MAHAGRWTPKERLRPCGTEAAYTRHKRKGEVPCDLCKQEMARVAKARMQAYRKGQRIIHEATAIAKEALVFRHQAEYKQLYDAALAEVRAEEHEASLG